MRYPIHILVALVSGSVLAETPRDFLTRFEKEAGAPAVPERGARFFGDKHGNDWSCSTCHTSRPTQSGRHDKTGKTIAPLAPAANAERFTSSAKVDKWFRRNCNDVVGRECSAREKADLLAWLLTLK
ncbi:MAG: DUF1924 domain-containing protein [Rugosibacter sp.]|nr:DUF1924 domain-containing protein [Rugosibacter sp.]